MTQYVYDRDAIIATYDPSGNVIARYAHGLAIDEPLAIQKGSSTYYYHADALGSIVALTNTSGGLAQTYSYDSFGNVTPSGSVVQPYTFTARENDSEAGLYYYRARYYDPRAGRFITKDPIGFAGEDENLYRYVKNDPVNWVDPWGLFKLPAGPNGLPPGWTPDTSHKDPNGTRFRDPSGRPLDWHPGEPGAPGWKGKDHWHDPNNFGKKHLPPGCDVPDGVKPKPLPPPGWTLPSRFTFPPILLFPGQVCLIDPNALGCPGNTI